jgi:hypothetical protein
MDPTLNSRLEWLIHLLTQVVLTSFHREPKGIDKITRSGADIQVNYSDRAAPPLFK